MTPADTKSATRREIQVEVPAEVVSRETDSVVQKLQKVARLPGFRRGKVPATVIRTRFPEDIKSEVVEALVPRYFRLETEKQGLVPVSQPRVSDLHIHDGEPLRFKAIFDVMPEIQVSGYHDLPVERPDTTVSDEDVEHELSHLREQHATYTAVEDRALADGDYAQVSLQGIPKNAAGGPEGAASPENPHPAASPGAPARAEVARDGVQSPVNLDDVMVEIGGDNTVREFSDNMRGATPGETRTFQVSYPQDFTDRRLAGQTFDYTVSVKSIKQKQLPELNDDFAKEIGSFTGIDDLKQKIREGLEHDKQHAAEREGKQKLVEELVKRNEFEVPEALVERQIDLRLERGLRALAAQGMKPEDMKKMDFNRLRAGQRDLAEREVKASLLLDRIAEAEHIEVSDEEIEKEVQALATQTQQTPESVRARLTAEGALDRIRNRLRNDKALDFLYRRPA